MKAALPTPASALEKPPRLTPDAPPWSAGRFARAVALLFLVQVVVIWLLGQRSTRPPLPEVFPTAVSLAPNVLQGVDEMDDINVYNPALLALPSTKGFSGKAWLEYRPLELQWTDWLEATNWLNLSLADVGNAAFRAAEQDPPAPHRVADRAPPAPLADVVVVPNPSLRTASTVQVEGDLALRPWLEPPTLLSWAHGNVLTNTVLQVAVQDDGWVFTAALLSSCGWHQADSWALSQARQARFAPIPRMATTAPGGAPPVPGITFGRLVFAWHTVPIPASLNTAQTNR